MSKLLGQRLQHSLLCLRNHGVVCSATSNLLAHTPSFVQKQNRVTVVMRADKRMVGALQSTQSSKGPAGIWKIATCLMPLLLDGWPYKVGQAHSQARSEYPVVLGYFLWKFCA